MRRTIKVKTSVTSIPLRLSALSAPAAPRRGFPAWIDSEERGVVFSARTVTPRVRNALVLRKVRKNRPAAPANSSHAHGAR